MDRNVVIATVLIGLIMFGWLYMMGEMAPPPPPAEDGLAADSVEVVTPPVDQPVVEEAPSLTAPPSLPADSALAAAAGQPARFVTVENEFYRARFSTKGGTLVGMELKEYKKFDQETPVELVDTDGDGALGLVFTTPTNHLIDTRTLAFETPFAGEALQVSGDTARLVFSTRLGQGAIRYVYTFAPESYEIGFDVVQENAASFQTDDGYEVVWNGALPFTEALKNRKEEAISLGAYARSGDEVEGVTLSGDTFAEKTLRGEVSWIAVKNKYFAAVVIPDETPREAELVGERFGELDDPALREDYRASLLMPPPLPGEGTDTFRLYLGPLEFYRITAYDIGLYGMVDYGIDFFEWMTRPLAKFIFIPLFTLLGGWLPNYGLVIIILAILVKVAVYPLTKSSYRSMAKMRELQPLMQEIKEKYADDPQKQQEATMKMYRETGVNPLGGCLPMLLQYPIIIALWQYLQQSIQIRQQGFLWANDLSAPDIILDLPFKIPIYGDYVAGFTLLMGLSLIVQMRVQSTPASGMQGKILMYVMPFFIFFIFNQLPSGLSLYYLVYNVVTAIQQKWINRVMEKEKEEAADGKGSPRDKRKKAAKLPRNGKAPKKGKKVRTR